MKDKPQLHPSLALMDAWWEKNAVLMPGVPKMQLAYVAMQEGYRIAHVLGLPETEKP